MTASNSTLERDAVVVEIDIAASPELIFQALTDRKQLFAWWSKEPSVELTEMKMNARQGGHWQFRWKPVEGIDHGAVGEQLRRNGSDEFEAHGEILEYDPPHLLVWSWIANWHEQPTHPTIVRWELTPTKDGTRVRVTHSGLSQEHISRKDYTSGWVGVLRLLKDYVTNSAMS
jgi:uncharacterized protein YndB with AHSA1/START domain